MVRHASRVRDPPSAAAPLGPTTPRSGNYFILTALPDQVEPHPEGRCNRPLIGQMNVPCL